MKKTTLGKLLDNQSFRLSPKSEVYYFVVLKEKGGVLYSSSVSGRTFKRKAKTVVYI